MRDPTEHAWTMLKRLGRYLKATPRVVIRFERQQMPRTIEVSVDSDWAGCLKTRKSTTGLAVMFGGHSLKTQSNRQSNIAFSSGEAEYGAMVKGCAVALGIQSYTRDLGMNLELVVWSDSKAAIGI